MKKLLIVVIILGTFSIAWSAEKPKQITPEQRIENLLTQVLSWKSLYGQELARGAQLERQLMIQEKKIKELQEKLKVANAKIEKKEKNWKITDRPVKTEVKPDDKAQSD